MRSSGGYGIKILSGYTVIFMTRVSVVEVLGYRRLSTMGIHTVLWFNDPSIVTISPLFQLKYTSYWNMRKRVIFTSTSRRLAGRNLPNQEILVVDWLITTHVT